MRENETFFEHFGLNADDNTSHTIFIDFKGDHWQEEDYLDISKDDLFEDICQQLEEVWEDLNLDFFDPKEEGIYEEDFDNADDYSEAYDDAWAESECHREIKFKLDGQNYSLELSGEVIPIAEDEE